MGILQDFANTQAVNEALKKGVQGYDKAEKNETDILLLKENTEFTPRFIGGYNIPWLIDGQGSLYARLYQLQKNVFSIDINGGGAPYTTDKTSYTLPVDIPVRRYNDPSNYMAPCCSPVKVVTNDDEKLLIGMVGYNDGTIIFSTSLGKAVTGIAEANIIVYGELIEEETTA